MFKPFPFARSAARRLAVLGIACFLVACGGGGPDSAEAVREPAEKRLAGASEKALATRIPVYRFFNTRTGAHFYTTSEAEKADVLATKPFMTYDGPAFSAASAFSPGLSPVHRFYNTRTGVHFYTISETERASIAATLPHFTYEGVAYHASQVAGQGLTPLYRFFVPSRGFHFYTASAQEKQSIQSTLAGLYTYEGIGYYVLDSRWLPEKLPHTGITGTQCYKADSNAFADCFPTLEQQLSGRPTSVGLNAQQDGRRGSINPMRYERVPSAVLMNSDYAVTTCIRDSVTGLMWEGKTATGERAGSNLYTNDGTGAADDASGYVTNVNAAGLCGYNDWRMPTAFELQTLLDYGAGYPAGTSTYDTWFPNSRTLSDGISLIISYWAVKTPNAYAPFFVSFNDGYIANSTLSNTSRRSVRLVRGALLSGTRFTYSSVPYGSDAANNLVNDALSGLQWRRCAEGMTWTGSSCSGSALTLNHQSALARAGGQAGWRLPNVRELGSLVVRPTGFIVFPSASDFTDTMAFPQSPIGTFWASTPYVSSPQQAWTVSFANGVVVYGDRASTQAVRLVRTNP
ncbi:DUF1566 domain-containing protein [Hydrogenophaga sp. RWCD_12]|uniref:DUF1566 domain-containing protein n=1 Tax=Hydrogenophaga sp. RWCD_12 TaxID=3391190 RepID=UPI003984EDF9